MATPEQALEKLKYYCAYQDRCHKEVKQKLYQLKVWGEDAEEIMATLIQDDYLNEERYACSFARGKFRMKQWGKKKIQHALKTKDISTYCIKKAMLEIDEGDYMDTLRSLAQKKYDSLKQEKYLRRKYKVQRHLITKGYEFELVGEIMKEMF